jgi:hypothetical protein
LEEFELAALALLDHEAQTALLYALHQPHQCVLLLNDLEVALFLVVYVPPQPVHLLPDQQYHLSGWGYTFVCFS